jgi:superfamily II DNA or RNA helicase
LEDYLDDNHLHIIAAPGSGKTVLGLEVLRRINKPALILSPTLAIRDQWVDRFITLFLPPGRHRPDWISCSLAEPKLLTVTTYQGLHSAYTGRTGEQTDDLDNDEADGVEPPGDRSEKPNSTRGKRFIDKLRRAGIKTIVVDEAHHLRSEWWKCLVQVKRALSKPTIIALTATPPCDVSVLEWERYRELCGPVDAEISVPELVLQENLCPHQDYVYLSTPIQSEQAEIEEFRKNVSVFLKALLANTQFLDVLQGHPSLKEPNENIELILSGPEFFLGIAVFLKYVGRKAPPAFLDIIGVSKNKLPRMNLEWLEILLTGCLYLHAESFPAGEALFKEMAAELSRIGAVERRKVRLLSTNRVAKVLISSISKLNSICQIVRIENDSLGCGLRMVILTDFIRKADLPRNEDDLKPLKRIGVVPVFEKIRRSDITDIELGVLSGTLVIVPRSSTELLEKIAAEMEIDSGRLKFSLLRHDESYCALDIVGQDRQKIVRLITRLFNQGGITVLVGTKSLLGEGWDAPSINSLILASFVGSYMLSNQMRGRAIRTQAGKPEKAANIWHLVCVEPRRKEPGSDLDTLSRRFKAFLGVSFSEPVIENGLTRLGIGEPPFAATRIDEINAVMRERALDRARLRNDWWQALQPGGRGVSTPEELQPLPSSLSDESVEQSTLHRERLRRPRQKPPTSGDQSRRTIEQYRASPSVLPRAFVFANALIALLWQAIFWAGFVLTSSLRSVERAIGDHDSPVAKILTVVALGCVIAAAVALPKFVKALYILLGHATVTSSMTQIGRVVLKTLIYIGLIRTDIKRIRVVAGRDRPDRVSCSLVGATTYEKSVFLDALHELLGPIENPRYLMAAKTLLGTFMRKDYHAVPQVVGRKREFADYLNKMWARYVGPAELNYTRSVKGRRLLAKARGNSLSDASRRDSERVKLWK